MTAAGVGKGDAVAVYLPMSRGGSGSAPRRRQDRGDFIPVFSGYAAEAVATRLEDPKPHLMICANGFSRRGRMVAMKEIADAAIEMSGGLERVLVIDYAGRGDTPMTEGRDIWWHETVPGA